MALLANPDLPGGVRYADPLYYITNQIARDKVIGVISGNLLAYASESIRRRHKLAIEELWKQQRKQQELQLQIAELANKPSDDPDIKLQAQMELAGLQVMLAKTQVAVRAAETALQQKDLTTVSISEFRVPAKDAADMMRSDGSVDEPKLYQWLKNQPEMKGAVDA